MSVPQARVSSVAERWDRTRVLAMAPDAPSQRTAQQLASVRAWPLTGAAEPGALWGECPGGPPDWAGSWLSARAAKANHAQPAETAEPKDPKAAARRAEQREARVAAG